MRTSAGSVLLLASLTLCGCSPSPAPVPNDIVGRWTQHVDAHDNPSWRGLIGDWEHDFRADGRFFVRETGGANMWLEGKYRFDGSILTLNDIKGSAACRGFGVDYASASYRVRFFSGGLQFEPIRDECTPRKSGMTMLPWQRAH